MELAIGHFGVKALTGPSEPSALAFPDILDARWRSGQDRWRSFFYFYRIDNDWSHRIGFVIRKIRRLSFPPISGKDRIIHLVAAFAIRPFDSADPHSRQANLIVLSN